MTETVIGIHQTAQLAVTRHVETLGTGCLGLLKSTRCLYQNLTLYPHINVCVCLQNDCIVPGQWYRPPPAWTLAASLSCPHTPAPGQYRVFRNVSYKYRVFVLA